MRCNRASRVATDAGCWASVLFAFDPVATINNAESLTREIDGWTAACCASFTHQQLVRDY